MTEASGSHEESYGFVEPGSCDRLSQVDEPPPGDGSPEPRILWITLVCWSFGKETTVKRQL